MKKGATSQGAAQKILHRFQEALLIEEGVKLDPHLRDQRPSPTQCTSLPLAEDVRRTVVREISRKVSKMQDPVMEEASLRTLNEELNGLVREKEAWDQRILQLGGIEKNAMRWQTEASSDLLPPSASPLALGGKLYFGRAKELPEYQLALRERQSHPKTEKQQQQRFQHRLTPFYYGYLADGAEAALVQAEREAEEVERKRLADKEAMVVDWQTGLPIRLSPSHFDAAGMAAIQPPPVHIPSQAEVEAMLVERRKAQLIKEFK